MDSMMNILPEHKLLISDVRQNGSGPRHGWQSSTIRAIVDNPRYTGFVVYGRWQKVEELLNPDDVAAGHVVRFRRSAQAKIVRSREPAHPAIISVEDFTRVQLELRGASGCEPGRPIVAESDTSGGGADVPVPRGDPACGVWSQDGR